jgi:hypothetical protein
MSLKLVRRIKIEPSYRDLTQSLHYIFIFAYDLLRLAVSSSELVQILPDRHRPGFPEETLEIFAFMEAADESKRLCGQPVKIREVMKKHGG